MAHISLSFVSTSLMREVTVEVLLPNDYSALYGSKPPYKTLYFLPGYAASATQLIDYLPLRAHSELKGIAVVIPNGENAFYLDKPAYNDNFSTFVSKELIEFTRSVLPLSDKPEDTFIGGISMGGFGSLYNGLTHPETFSKIAAFSPALTVFGVPGFTSELTDHFFGSEEEFKASDANIAEAFLRDRPRPQLWLGCGQQDVLVWEQNKAFEESLQAAGISHEWMELPGNHDIHCWEQMMDRAFSFLAGIEPGTKEFLAL